jgi:hypothetical protein
MRLILLTVLLVQLFLHSSCNKQKPANEAFYITASNINVKTSADQGSGSHKITDLWLYVDGKFQGAYPIGNKMPIVSKGKAVKINLMAGVKNNGISDTRIPWPFYEILNYDTLVESGKSITRSFEFQYKPTTTFTWTENFDGIGTTLVKSSSSVKTITIAPAQESFEGRSGVLTLEGNDYFAQVETFKDYELPIGSPNVYLELNYKCNSEFNIGLIGNSGEQKPIMSLNKQDNWNKIYIQLSTAVSSAPVSVSYKLYFTLIKAENDTETKRLFLDNIKLIYFE